MSRFLVTMFFALAVNELIHNALETWSIRQKVRWLQACMDKRSHGNWPMHIESWYQVVLIHFGLLVLFSGSAYLVAGLMDISTILLAKISILLLLMNYTLTTFYIDAYHRDIGVLLKRFKKL